MEETPLCPGCHLTCSLDDPQCARGLDRFRPMWLAGEEIPQRRTPGGPGPKGPKGPGGPKRPPHPRGGNGPSQSELLLFLLTEVTPRALGELKGSMQEQVLECLMRHEGGATYGVLLERIHGDEQRVYTALEELLQSGGVEESYTDWGTQFYWIAPQGKERAAEAKAANKAAVEERMGVLTPKEQETLEELLSKILQAGR